MTTPDRKQRTHLEVVERFDDDLGWLVQRTLRDAVAPAKPLPVVWQRIQQQVTLQATHTHVSWPLRLWRRWCVKWADLYTTLETSYPRQPVERNFYFYLGTPLLLEPQSRVWA